VSLSVDKIAVLLATYNGEKYLSEQIESICNQSHSNFVLFIRDDNSQDQTRYIITEYAKSEARICPVESCNDRLGVNNNFDYLTEYAKKGDFQYFSYSDQDDVWMKDKLSSELMILRELEKENLNKPVLVHSDLEVVNELLETVNKSFMKDQGINDEIVEPLKALLAQNYITGCTILINRALADIAFPIPKEALIYDWWIALSGAVFGCIGYLDNPTVRYRQHTGNQVGAKSLYSTLNPITTNWIKQWKSSGMRVNRSKDQAKALEKIMRERDSTNKNIRLVMNYVDLFSRPRFKRILSLLKLGIHKQSSIRNIFFILHLLGNNKYK